MAREKTPLVGVVICTYDRYPLLPQTIERVLDQTLPTDDYEVVVVDNSPDQAAAARFAERYRDEPRLRYVLEARPGAANARNAGAALARSARVAFVDDDVAVSRGWLRALLDAFAAFPDAGVVGGRVLGRWSDPRPNWLHDKLLGYISLVDWGGPLRVAARHEWLASCNMAVARDEFRALGGFSLALGRAGSGAMLLSNEDTDLVRRMVARGRPAVYAPDAVVEHLIDPARLTRSWFRGRGAWQAVSDLLTAPAAIPARAADAAARLRLAAGVRGDAPPGVFTATDDPKEFFEQVQIAYHQMIALLGEGTAAGPEPPRGSSPADTDSG
jgi:GT2 family glycosyltransferase